MISRRRMFVFTLLGCTLVSWNGTVNGQGVAGTANLDAVGVAANSASLPPPAPLPQNTLESLNPPAPPAAAFPTASVHGAGASVEPTFPQSGTVTLPTLPSTVSNVAIVPSTNVVPAYDTPSDVPPVVLPSAPAPLPQVIEPAKALAPTDAPPLISTAAGGPVPPTIERSEILAIQRHPLPAVTPSSPLIPTSSLAGTINQKRQLTTLPGSGGDTNYAYATIGGPDGPPRPLITPPTVLDPQPGYDIGKDYPPLQAVMPDPASTPFRLDEPRSALGTPNPPSSLNYYLSPTLHRNPDAIAINPSPGLAEIIVLRGGQEFQGLILERGDMWRVELLNGTIINIPGNKVAHVRKLLAVPTSTPSARNMAFPPVEYYREQQLR